MVAISLRIAHGHRRVIISAGTAEISKRYGYIYVDYDDYGNGSGNLYKKDSFYWYKNVIETNGQCLNDVEL